MKIKNLKRIWSITGGLSVGLWFLTAYTAIFHSINDVMLPALLFTIVVAFNNDIKALYWKKKFKKLQDNVIGEYDATE